MPPEDQPDPLARTPAERQAMVDTVDETNRLIDTPLITPEFNPVNIGGTFTNSAPLNAEMIREAVDRVMMSLDISPEMQNGPAPSGSSQALALQSTIEARLRERLVRSYMGESLTPELLNRVSLEVAQAETIDRGILRDLEATPYGPSQGDPVPAAQGMSGAVYLDTNDFRFYRNTPSGRVRVEPPAPVIDSSDTFGGTRTFCVRFQQVLESSTVHYADLKANVLSRIIMSHSLDQAIAEARQSAVEAGHAWVEKAQGAGRLYRETDSSLSVAVVTVPCTCFTCKEAALQAAAAEKVALEARLAAEREEIEFRALLRSLGIRAPRTMDLEEYAPIPEGPYLPSAHRTLDLEE